MAAGHPAPVRDVCRVSLGERSYDIVIGEGLLEEAGPRIHTLSSAPRIVVVTDATVAGLYLERLERSLSAAGLAHASVVLPPGEQTKDYGHLQRLIEQTLSFGVERGSVLVALGGGVVGDITGLAAGLLLRGLAFVQVPTTLLAQVDSSVGGKTGINSPHGKNLIGLFHQPRLVLADVATLDTLDARQLRAGYAEVVKYAAIGDPVFFDWLEAHGAAICEGSRSARVHAVMTSCAAKASIVAADEREAGTRALLNLGHTFAHALEAETGYGDALVHGEAVALGMVLAFELSSRLGLCPVEDGLRLRRHLEAIGLPTDLRAVAGAGWTEDALLEHMRRDKKVRDSRLTFILVRGIGRAFISRDVPLHEVRSMLRAAIGAWS